MDDKRAKVEIGFAGGDSVAGTYTAIKVRGFWQGAGLDDKTNK